MDMIVNVMLDPGHRLHGAMTRSLGSILERKARPSDLRIFGALVDGARQGKHDAQVARELGLSRAAVSQAKARVKKLIVEAVKKDPRILEPILRQQELQQLGWARRGVQPLGSSAARPDSSLPSMRAVRSEAAIPSSRASLTRLIPFSDSASFTARLS